MSLQVNGYRYHVVWPTCLVYSVVVALMRKSFALSFGKLHIAPRRMC